MAAADLVYLDYNATAPVKPAVRAAVIAALDLAGNPSSVHGPGRLSRRAVETARAEVAALGGVAPAAVVFTGGGTEANALALSGLPDLIPVVSALEHDSVLAAVPGAARLPARADGTVDLDALDATLAALPGPALVSVMLVNNETGVIQPLAEIARRVHALGGLVHCDAIQGAGRLPLTRAALGWDLLSLSAHKLGGPKGVGALLVPGDPPLRPLLRGGGQERRRRAGTENVPGIAGFGVAAALAAEDLADQPRLRALRDGLERRLLAAVPAARVHGAAAPRVANTLCLGLPGLPGETQVMALDLAGVAVSAGSACSSGRVQPSAVLRAMGLDADAAASAIRISLGWASTAADTDRLAAAWIALARHRGLAVAS